MLSWDLLILVSFARNNCEKKMIRQITVKKWHQMLDTIHGEGGLTQEVKQAQSVLLIDNDNTKGLYTLGCSPCLVMIARVKGITKALGHFESPGSSEHGHKVKEEIDEFLSSIKQKICGNNTGISDEDIRFTIIGGQESSKNTIEIIHEYKVESDALLKQLEEKTLVLDEDLFVDSFIIDGVQLNSIGEEDNMDVMAMKNGDIYYCVNRCQPVMKKKRRGNESADSSSGAGKKPRFSFINERVNLNVTPIVSPPHPPSIIQ